jgi:hypothetical protein
MPFKINPQNSAVEYSSGEPLFSMLSADQSVSASATVVAIPELQFTVARFQRVEFSFELYYTTVAAAGFRYLLTIPTSPTVVRLVREHIAPDALTTVVTTMETPDGTTNRTITNASGTLGYIRGSGFIHNGSTAGTIGLSFAQNASDAGATIVRAGSYIQGITI